MNTGRNKDQRPQPMWPTKTSPKKSLEHWNAIVAGYVSDHTARQPIAQIVFDLDQANDPKANVFHAVSIYRDCLSTCICSPCLNQRKGEPA